MCSVACVGCGVSIYTKYTLTYVCIRICCLCVRTYVCIQVYISILGMYVHTYLYTAKPPYQQTGHIAGIVRNCG